MDGFSYENSISCLMLSVNPSTDSSLTILMLHNLIYPKGMRIAETFLFSIIKLLPYSGSL